MQIFLQRKGIFLSKTTVFKYKNKELNLHSITRLKKSRYKKGIVHKVYENEVNQEFNVKEKNKVSCTDFTYIRLRNGKMRCNCSILDLYDRAVVASVNSKYINTETAINTLTIALKKETIKNTLILHSDQGSQFTSYEFGQFCANNKIVQSMSRAGCPYDNAVMERFYKTFKMEFIYLHSFVDDEDLDRKTNVGCLLFRLILILLYQSNILYDLYSHTIGILYKKISNMSIWLKRFAFNLNAFLFHKCKSLVNRLDFESPGDIISSICLTTLIRAN